MNKKMKATLLGATVMGCLMALAPAAPTTFKSAPILKNVAAGKWSNDLVKQTRNLDPFSKIYIKGAIELTLVGGKDQKVDVEVEEEYLDQLITTVKNDTLIIDMSKKGKKKYWGRSGTSLYITLPVLQAIELDGAMDGTFKNLNGSDLLIDIHGAGNMQIEGSCGTLTVRLKGAGNIEAKDFKCKNADLTLSGAGNIEAYATESAEIELGGIGNVDIYGSPEKIRKTKDGIGSIDIK